MMMMKNRQGQTSMPQAGFKPNFSIQAINAYALEHTATGIGSKL
jgi:hypothetical protein